MFNNIRKKERARTGLAAPQGGRKTVASDAERSFAYQVLAQIYSEPALGLALQALGHTDETLTVRARGLPCRAHGGPWCRSPRPCVRGPASPLPFRARSPLALSSFRRQWVVAKEAGKTTKDLKQWVKMFNNVRKKERKERAREA